jgi:hypothetical protein
MSKATTLTLTFLLLAPLAALDAADRPAKRPNVVPCSTSRAWKSRRDSRAAV